jgi:hypothetical protein
MTDKELLTEKAMIYAGDWAGYAALWGCDPCYDKAPRQPGDGYRFYNFGVEGHDPAFLAFFLPAIDRTMKGDVSKHDRHNLGLLRKEVMRRIVAYAEGAPVGVGGAND